MPPIYIIHTGSLPMLYFGWDVRQKGHPRKTYVGDFLVSEKRCSSFDFTNKIVYNRAGGFELKENETLHKARALYNPPDVLALDNKAYFWNNFPRKYQVPTAITKEECYEQFDAPVIAKPYIGAESRKIHKLMTNNEIREFNERNYIYQPLLDIQNEYKLFIIDNELAFTLLRNRDTFVFGKGFVQEDYQLVKLDHFSFNYEPIKKYFATQGRIIASLDLIETTGGERFVLEINFSFGFKWHNIIGLHFWKAFDERVRNQYE